MRNSPVVSALAVFAALLSPVCALANGALAFLGTATTVSSGSSNSYMNLYADCAGTCSAPSGVAVPSVTSPMTVTTQKVGTTDLKFIFSIPDQTPTKPGGAALTVGDKIVIQLDPNGTGDTGLEFAGGINTDYRYEVTYKNGQLTGALRRIPVSATGWGSTPGTSVFNLCTTFPTTNCTGTLGTVTISGGPPYVVTITIPLAQIGSPPGDFRLAMAVVNDLGHDSLNSMGVTVQDLTAVVFPSGTLPASSGPYSDPGVIPSVPAGTAWTTPSNWGLGYTSAPGATEAQLSLSQLPVSYLSNSLKVSVCDAATWDEIGVADTSFDQTMLAKWYIFNRVDPCKMGIWVKVANRGALASARLLVLWAEGGPSASGWQTVTLTDPIAFLPGESTFKIPWAGVLPAPGGFHACLRVYVVPAAPTPTQQAAIAAITDYATAMAFEATLAFPIVAQMNFTRYEDGSCAAGICNKVAESSWSQFFLASLDALGPRPAYAQTVTRELRATPVAKQPPRLPEAGFPFAVVTVQAYAVSEAPKVSYRFVEPIGGMGAAVPFKAFANKPLVMAFPLTNPPLYATDPKTKKQYLVKTTPRRILLAAKADAPKGQHVSVKVTELKGTMKPGETRKVTTTVSLDKRHVEPGKKDAGKTKEKAR